MEYLILIFLHVLFGIFWAGGAIVAGFFILPAVVDAGPAGGAVMAGVVRRRLPVIISLAAVIVLLTGVRLYMLRFTPEWFLTKEGLVLSLGALLAIGAFVIGLFVQKPVAERLGALAGQLAAAGSAPTAAQAAELQALRARLRRVANLTAWHLLVASILMAGHRLAAVL